MTPNPESAPANTTAKHSNSYNIFILLLTVLSLAIMVFLMMPISPETRKLLNTYDNLIAFIFLFDFANNMLRAEKKKDYFIGERGWLDLLGSIPTLGISQYAGLLRLARLSRLFRITRLMRGKEKEALVKDVIENRGQYTAFITILSTMLVLTVGSVLVLQFESVSPNANIHTGWDSLWYSIVTITTVGYGDRYPVTVGGRITAMAIMFMGVGIIGALASILSSVLVGGGQSAPEPEKEAPAQPAASKGEIAALRSEMTAMRSELAALHQLVEKMTPKE